MASFQEFPSIPFRIWNDMDQEQYLFDINAITSQILTIGEFYRYKDTWRFKTIGEGYRGDWKTLQKEYHITFPENGHIMKL
jgi:stress response protein SCP2